MFGLSGSQGCALAKIIMIKFWGNGSGERYADTIRSLSVKTLANTTRPELQNRSEAAGSASQTGSTNRMA